MKRNMCILYNYGMFLCNMKFYRNKKSHIERGQTSYYIPSIYLMQTNRRQAGQ